MAGQGKNNPMSRSISTDVDPVNLAGGKSGEVRSFFENTDLYLPGYELNIRIRAETVRELTEGFSFQNVLDVGCGNGSISVPLLTHERRVTFLDLSSNMTSIAQSRVPPEFAANATFVNENIMQAKLEPASYDLIICLGVMAHADAPDALVGRLAALLKPGGRLILEFSDSRHPLGRVARGLQWVAALRRPRSYSLNALSFGKVSGMLREHELQLLSAFRYNQLLYPVLTKRMPQRVRYNLVRGTFGDARRNRRARLGNEYICLLTNAPK